jgi:hypothetical protein
LFSRDCVLATFVRPPGGNRSCSLSTRDFVPGNIRSPCGRKEKVFIAHQGLRPWQRSCALRAGKQKLFIVQQGLRPWQHSFALRARIEVIHGPPGTSSLATLARPPGENTRCSLSALRAETEVVGCPPGGLRFWQHSPALRAEPNDASAPRRLTNS